MQTPAILSRFSSLIFVLGLFNPIAALADKPLEFIPVPAGCFEMGTMDGEKHEQPVHRVCLSSFEIGKHEVTQEQWLAIIGSNPSRFKKCGPDCPVEQVSWHSVQNFISLLNDKNPGQKHRLPTEAEWEYACRSAGKDGAYPAGINEDNLATTAWSKESSNKRTQPVGLLRPNGLGIFDMNGNVWEWVQDSFETPYNTSLGEKNPVYEGGEERVLRGGSWDGKANYVRCHIRNRKDPEKRDLRLGFRLVREVRP